MNKRQVREVREMLGIHRKDWCEMLEIDNKQLQYLENPTMEPRDREPNMGKLIPVHFPYTYAWMMLNGGSPNVVPAIRDDVMGEIRKYRQRNKLPSADMAMTFGIEHAHFIKMENGHKRPKRWLWYAFQWVCLFGDRDPFATIYSYEGVDLSERILHPDEYYFGAGL